MKKKIIISASICCLIIIAIVVGCNLAVIYNGKGRVFDRAEEVPYNTYGLLLATSPITPGGTHNFYFENRITAADSLFKLGRIDYIIASGEIIEPTISSVAMNLRLFATHLSLVAFHPIESFSIMRAYAPSTRLSRQSRTVFKA